MLDVAAASEVTGNLTIQDYGTLTGSGDITIAGSLNWTGGEIIGDGVTTIAPGGTLNMAANHGAPCS